MASNHDYISGNLSDSGSMDSPGPRFPHIHLRAQLGSIHRLYKPLETYDSDAEDDSTRVSSSLVQQVVSLLEDEKEDELKALLRDTYEMDPDTVSFLFVGENTCEYAAHKEYVARTECPGPYA